MMRTVKMKQDEVNYIPIMASMVIQDASISRANSRTAWLGSS